MAHQNIVWHVWTTSIKLQKLMTKLQVNLFVMVIELLYNISVASVSSSHCARCHTLQSDMCKA
jgi:hypothetical protein